jgi:hypothetical protein
MLVLQPGTGIVAIRAKAFTIAVAHGQFDAILITTFASIARPANRSLTDMSATVR